VFDFAASAESELTVFVARLIQDKTKQNFQYSASCKVKQKNNIFKIIFTENNIY